ncbi:hypothetical protein CR513_14376, partial [Mucuna pruriens]
MEEGERVNLTTYGKNKKNQHEVLDTFNVFEVEVEKQYGEQIKIVRSNRGREYYDRYIDNGQAPNPFANTKIVESRNENFLPNDLISGIDQFQDIVYEKDHYKVQPYGLSHRMIVIHSLQVQMGVRQPRIVVLQVVENNCVDQTVDEK